MLIKVIALLTAAALTGCTHAAAATAPVRADHAAFVDEMVAKHGFERDALVRLFAGLETRQDIIDAITRPAEALPWHRYRNIFLTGAPLALVLALGPAACSEAEMEQAGAELGEAAADVADATEEMVQNAGEATEELVRNAGAATDAMVDSFRSAASDDARVYFVNLDDGDVVTSPVTSPAASGSWSRTTPSNTMRAPASGAAIAARKTAESKGSSVTTDISTKSMPFSLGVRREVQSPTAPSKLN